MKQCTIIFQKQILLMMMLYIVTNFSPKLAELLTNEQASSDDKDVNNVVADIETNNGSYFAQWIQQERFPQFVKVHISNELSL